MAKEGRERERKRERERERERNGNENVRRSTQGLARDRKAEKGRG